MLEQLTETEVNTRYLIPTIRFGGKNYFPQNRGDVHADIMGPMPNNIVNKLQDKHFGFLDLRSRKFYDTEQIPLDSQAVPFSNRPWKKVKRQSRIIQVREDFKNLNKVMNMDIQPAVKVDGKIHVGEKDDYHIDVMNRLSPDDREILDNSDHPDRMIGYYHKPTKSFIPSTHISADSIDIRAFPTEFTPVKQRAKWKDPALKNNKSMSGWGFDKHPVANFKHKWGLKQGSTQVVMGEAKLWLPSKTLNIERIDMPQISAKLLPNFIDWLKKQGIKTIAGTTSVKDMKPTQNQFKRLNILSWMKNLDTIAKPILLSKDGYILDGHHRWLALVNDGMRKNTVHSTNTLTVDLPIQEFIKKAKEYHGTEYRSVNEGKKGGMDWSAARKRYKAEVDAKPEDKIEKSTAYWMPAVMIRGKVHLQKKRWESHGAIVDRLSQEDKDWIDAQPFPQSTDIFGFYDVRERKFYSQDKVDTNRQFKYSLDSASLPYSRYIENKEKRKNYRVDKVYVREDNINEGLHDPAIFKAVFVVGGPGSGKDYILNNTIKGLGLSEINSDIALEYLMKKNNLSLKMVDSESEMRNRVRGRAKNVMQDKNRLAMAGRLGIIINGTGDDVSKLTQTKQRLEEAGYETMMIFVHASDEVSKWRNIIRGQQGGRTVPENIRSEKWLKSNSNMKTYQNLFGENFILFDNSTDTQKADILVKRSFNEKLLYVYKTVAKFIKRPVVNQVAINWKEDQKRVHHMKEHAGFEGTNELVKNYQDVTPGQENADIPATQEKDKYKKTISIKN